MIFISGSIPVFRRRLSLSRMKPDGAWEGWVEISRQDRSLEVQVRHNIAMSRVVVSVVLVLSTLLTGWNLTAVYLNPI